LLMSETSTHSLIRESPVALYLQIEQELRGLLESGDLGPNAQVPSEIQLSDRFHVSRMTARKALDRLVAEGILFRQPGKGTFVAAPKITHGVSTQLSFSKAMAALGLRHHTRVLNATRVPAPAHIASLLGLHAGESVVFLRRLRFVEDEPAALHLSYLPGRYAGVLNGDLSGSLIELMDAVGAHVVDSLDSVEAVIGQGEDARLLRVASGTSLVRIEGVAFSSNRDPLKYNEALYRGDRFRFTVDTSGPPTLRLELKTL
jgi:DNA-binding GntR family transcriptional regulator